MNQQIEILHNLKKQISVFFTLSEKDTSLIEKHIPDAYNRSLYCFKHINNKYFNEFNLLHSGQYACFLYFLSHEIFSAQGTTKTSEKIYYLNKIMHSLDLYYEVKMPAIFYWEHPLGTVLGRAAYSNNFIIYQGCTVGGSFDANGDIHYPQIAENVTLYSNSSILGNCKIGKNSIIASHAYVINQDIPENSIVFGQGKELVIKPNTKKTTLFIS